MLLRIKQYHIVPLIMLTVVSQNLLRSQIGPFAAVGLLFSGITLYFFLLRLGLTKQKIRIKPYEFSLLLWIFVCFIYFFIGYSKFGVFSILSLIHNCKLGLYYLTFLILFLSFRKFQKDIDRIVLFIILIFALHIYITFFFESYWKYIIFNNLVKGDLKNLGQFLALGEYRRGFGFDLTPVDSGFFICIALAFCLTVLKVKTPIAIYLIIAQFLTFNRTSIICLIVFLFFVLNKNWKIRILLILSIILIFGLSFFIDLQEIIFSLFKFSDSSALQRTEVSLPKAIDVLKQDYLGYGLGATHPKRSGSLYVESNFFNIFIETGFLGLLAIFSFFIFLCLDSFKTNTSNSKDYTDCKKSVFLSLFLASLPLVPLYSNTVCVLVGYILVRIRTE